MVIWILMILLIHTATMMSPLTINFLSCIEKGF